MGSMTVDSPPPAGVRAEIVAAAPAKKCSCEFKDARECAAARSLLIAGRIGQILLGSQISLGGLNGRMPQAHLNLIEPGMPAVCEFGERPPQIVRGDLEPDPPARRAAPLQRARAAPLVLLMKVHSSGEDKENSCQINAAGEILNRSPSRFACSLLIERLPERISDTLGEPKVSRKAS
jgi:hypothetical protein